jgi:hypothetical protein
MSNQTNVFSGIIEEFVFKSIVTPFANMPPRDIYTENFDDAIAQEGQVVHAHQNTTVYGALNDLANGWDNTPATASNYSASLKTLGKDHFIITTDWQTVGEQRILDMFGSLGRNVANGITVNVLNNITTGSFPNFVSINSSSLFNLTGSSGLQSIGTTLDNLETDQDKRFFITTPNAYQALVASSGVFQTLVYGGSEIIRGNGFKDVDGADVNSSHPGIHLAGFDIYKYPRLGTLGLVPYGGSQVSGDTSLIGFGGNRSALFAANRVPIPSNFPAVSTYTYVDPTSKFSLQYIMGLDFSKPGIRFGVYTLFGSAAANPNGMVRLITKSN